MKKIITVIFVFLFCFIVSSIAQEKEKPVKQTANPPIYIAFLWHMHQPVYRPGENVIQTDGSGATPIP